MNSIFIGIFDMFGFYDKSPYMLFDENVDINVYRRFVKLESCLVFLSICVYRRFRETESKTILYTMWYYLVFFGCL